MKHAYTTTRRVLHVTGYLWGGAKANSSYKLREGQPAPQSLVEAKALVGDFESLDSAKIVTTTQKVQEQVTTRRLKDEKPKLSTS